MSEHGWTLVKHRKNRFSKPEARMVKRNFDPKSVNHSQYSDLLMNTKPYREMSKFKLPIICLGLGPLTNRDSLIQLQLLVLLDSRVSFCDPIFTSAEVRYLAKLGFSPADNIKVHKKTMFFMIHCPHELYLDVVTINKENLHLITIVGNSFKKYQEIGMFCDLEFEEIALDCLGNTFFNTSLIKFLT